MLVKGYESFIPPNAPIVGVSPTLYTLPSFGRVFNPLLRPIPYPSLPFVNSVVPFNPITGQVGPAISATSSLQSMVDSIRSDSRYRPIIDNAVHSKQYNNNKINIGIIGTTKDIDLVANILNAHFTANP